MKLRMVDVPEPKVKDCFDQRSTEFNTNSKHFCTANECSHNCCSFSKGVSSSWPRVICRIVLDSSTWTTNIYGKLQSHSWYPWTKVSWGLRVLSSKSSQVYDTVWQIFLTQPSHDIPDLKASFIFYRTRLPHSIFTLSVKHSIITIQDNGMCSV